MFNQDNQSSSAWSGQCPACRHGMGGKMGMWMDMPKEVKIAKLEKKEAMIRAELEFISKMKDMVKNMPDKKGGPQ